MLGASLYLGEDLERNLEYIDFLNEKGVKSLFTSLHIPEENPEQLLDKLLAVTEKTQGYQMNITADISSDTFQMFGVKKDQIKNFVAQLKLTHLRIDYGLTYEELKLLSEDFGLVINASTVDEELCQKLEASGFSLEEIIACHNFYPRENTGLSKEFLKEKNAFLKEKGFIIAAFIPGDEKKRGPIFEGLPTLEDHRYTNLLESYLDLTKNFYVDQVFIGDGSVSDVSLEQLLKYQNEEVISLNVDTAEGQLPDNFYFVHQNRKDCAQDVIRAEDSRSHLKEQLIEPLNTVDRPRGSITLDNRLYGRYSGELQVSRVDLKQDDRVNVLGRVIKENIGLLKYVKGGTKFDFRGWS